MTAQGGPDREPREFDWGIVFPPEPPRSYRITKVSIEPGMLIGTAQEDLRAGDVVQWDPSSGRISRCL